MISDIIAITSSGENLNAALDLYRKVAAYSDLSPKGALHLRLLAEEMLSMIRSITGEVSGKFWIEAEDGEYKLHLLVNAALTKEKREELLNASTSGKNEATRSFMGRIRDFFFRGMNDEIASYNTAVLGAGAASKGFMPVTDWEWSLLRYQDTLSALKEKEPEAADAWDELEKSVVSNVADNVKVSIKGFETEMTIIKKLV
ncbi:MAG: hypothetical protein IJ119_14700 [Clostridia bacterium]|nr:hypothetical protein [Clostridia bacterium]